MAIFNSYVKLPEGNIIPPLAIEDTPSHVLGKMCSLATLDHGIIGRDQRLKRKCHEPSPNPTRTGCHHLPGLGWLERSGWRWWLGTRKTRRQWLGRPVLGSLACSLFSWGNGGNLEGWFEHGKPVRTIPYKVVDENGFRTSVALLFFVPERLSWEVLKPMNSGHSVRSSNIWILNRDISKDWTQELQFWTGISPGPQCCEGLMWVFTGVTTFLTWFLIEHNGSGKFLVHVVLLFAPLYLWAGHPRPNQILVTAGTCIAMNPAQYLA